VAIAQQIGSIRGMTKIDKNEEKPQSLDEIKAKIDTLAGQLANADNRIENQAALVTQTYLNIEKILTQLSEMQSKVIQPPGTIAATDHAVENTLKKLKTIDAGDDEETIVDRCFEVAKSTEKLGILNSFDYYQLVIDHLCNFEKSEFVSIADIAKPIESGKIAIALRHDVDADIVTAIKCANYLKSKSVAGTFFILHTSHYYGNFQIEEENLTFTRHEGFRTLLSQLRETDAEIGIHNDALGVIFEHGSDGFSAFETELAWLRSQDIKVTGTAAHNSPFVYGAECFEIFEGLAVADRKYIVWRGKMVPLQVLNMKKLGLDYEANHPAIKPVLVDANFKAITTGQGDALRDPDWQKAYFLNHPVFERGYDYDAWLIGNDSWLLAGNGTIHYPLGLNQLLAKLEKMPANSRIVISIHPIYVGKRGEQQTTTSNKKNSGPTNVPENFGFWWEKPESNLDWYDWMFHYRIGVHRSFIDWLQAREAEGDKFDSVLEVGPGRGVFYQHYFSNRHYTGLEYSKRNTAWLNENRKLDKHDFVNGDISTIDLDTKFDLVFSSGTIDNVPDMDAFIRGMVKHAKKSIYLTAYRGWFPELENHTITWSEETGAFYNDISPNRVKQLLQELGCNNITVKKLPTGREEIPFETLITADVR